MPDKLGMRHSGRPTIRLVPTNEEQGELAVEIGTAVDAWWSDGWWEGVVCGIDNSGDDSVQVYFPGMPYYCPFLACFLKLFHTPCRNTTVFGGIR